MPERPNARRYRVIDRLRLGAFSFRTAYTAEIEAVSPTEIRGSAWQSPGVRVCTRYRVEPAPVGTRLSERCVLTAPRLLLGYAARHAEAAHRETFAKLAERLGSDAGA